MQTRINLWYLERTVGSRFLTFYKHAGHDDERSYTGRAVIRRGEKQHIRVCLAMCK